MMQRSQRVRPVLKLAENKVQELARALGQEQQRLAQMQLQLTELERYRDLYQQEMKARSQDGLDIRQLREFHAFVERLESALRQQQQGLGQQQQRCDQVRGKYLAERARAQALDKVVERYHNEESAQLARREQNELDDLVQRYARMAE
jgi:flagellar FliJ protein